MIENLYISNYALIDKLEIDFEPGFNVITGQTGAGKSIVLGAIGLLKGERTNSSSVRHPGMKTVVEATFDVSRNDGVAVWLADNGIEELENEGNGSKCVMRREISPKGTSRGFINDNPVTMAQMQQLALRLMDIHSQNSHTKLADPDFQRELLDAMSSNSELLARYRQSYHKFKTALHAYTRMLEQVKRAKGDQEYNAHLLEQLDKLDYKRGEAKELEQERDILGNLSEIKALISSALTLVHGEGEDGVPARLAKAQTRLERLAQMTEDNGDLPARLQAARIEISDIAGTLLEYDARLNDSPQRLEQVEERLTDIYALQTRHGLASADDLVDVREKLRKAQAMAGDSGEMLAQLEEAARQAKKEAIINARELSRARTENALELARKLTSTAPVLGMANARCDIQVHQGKLNENGQDTVEFLFSFNRNQPLMPVSGRASGGEISRIMLALKAIMADKMQLPTVIFDEIDTGVSGEIANRMAELMNEISSATQVIAITHVATVAAHGTAHFNIYKLDDTTSDATHTYIRRLDETERIKELAAMISGNPEDQRALEAAKSMLLRHK